MQKMDSTKLSPNNKFTHTSSSSVYVSKVLNIKTVKFIRYKTTEKATEIYILTPITRIISFHFLRLELIL